MRGITPVIDSGGSVVRLQWESDRPAPPGDVPADRDCINGADAAGEQCGLDPPSVGQFKFGPSVPQRTS